MIPILTVLQQTNQTKQIIQSMLKGGTKMKKPVSLAVAIIFYHIYLLSKIKIM